MKEHKVFIAVLAAFSLLLLWRLDQPSGYLVFDEWWYVNAARVILGLPQTIGDPAFLKIPYPGAVAGLDPNMEHPPLVKLMLAVSMGVLGDNAYGWRIPSVLFGIAALVIFYLLVRKMTLSTRTASIAAFLLAFDSLFFVQSRLAMLDIFTLALMLFGFYWYLTRPTVYLSALAMALATLTKLTGAYGVLAILLFHAVKCAVNGGSVQERVKVWSRWAARYVALSVVVFVGLLWVLDHWTPFTSPIAHIAYMLNFAASKTSSCAPLGFCPWQWILNFPTMTYLNLPSMAVTFRGTASPTTLAITLLAIPYALISYRQHRTANSLYALTWFLATYLPYIPLVLILSRTTYPYYLLPALPAIAAATATLLTEQHLPIRLTIIYLTLVIVEFALLFPFKLW